MPADYTHKNLADVEDVAAEAGFGEAMEARFAKTDLDTVTTGLAYQRFKPGRRQPFGHRHEKAEEVYVVIRGSGRLRLGDDVLEVGELDAVRVSPGVMRAWEGGPDGIEILALGARDDDDRGETVPGWWSDGG